MLGALGVGLLGLLATDGCGYTTEAAPGAVGPDASGPNAPPGGDAGADAPRSDGSTLGPPVTECAAQRVVQLVGGNGGLAWFTQVWPIPDVISAYQPDFAYDDPKLAKLVSPSNAPPLFARLLPGPRAVWETVGARPMPTIFVAGTNLTHTSTPATTRLNGTTEILAAAWGVQKRLGAPIATVRIKNTYLYGPAPDAPKPVDVADVDAAVDALAAQLSLSATAKAQLRPDPSVYGSWHSSGAGAGVKNLAAALAFAANAFRANLVTTIQLPAFEDDPHGAFVSSPTQQINDVASVMDGFYKYLATSQEAICGHAGAKLSLADNVVTVIVGDTYKNPFTKNGWPDGTPQNTNLVFVRSNGFLAPGYFGRIAPGGVTQFDPATGGVGSSAPVATEGALEGILYAIARGDGAFVKGLAPTATPYQGILEASPP